MSKRKVSLLFHIGRVIFILLLVVMAVLAAARLYFRLPVADYYNRSEAAFEIPGIRDGFVPQGFDFDEENGLFLVSGYMDEKAPSPVYLVEKESGDIRARLTLKTDKGEAYTGHSGGIAVHGDYVYVAGGRGGYFYIYEYADFLAAQDGAAIECIGKFSTKKAADDCVAVSFITASDSHLWVGEFYHGEDYETLDSHKLTTKAGDYQQALAVAYPFDAEAEYGISPTPSVAYSLPDKVQGICFDGERAYLSTSFSFGFSHIYVHDMTRAEAQGEIALLGENLPLYAFDSASLAEDIKAPPMAEEVVVLDGRLYIMCESASDKYIFGKLTGGEYCYATKLS